MPMKMAAVSSSPSMKRSMRLRATGIPLHLTGSDPSRRNGVRPVAQALH
jgi:hypothetical protein